MINGDSPEDFKAITEINKSHILTNVLAILFSSISVSFALLNLLKSGIDIGFLITIALSFIIISFCGYNLFNLFKEK